MAWLPGVVNTNRTYTVDEVFYALKQESELPEPYLYEGLVGKPAIYIPGERDNDIQVLVGNGKITVTNVNRPKDVPKQIVRDVIIGLPVLFRGVNDRLFVHTIRECVRLFGTGTWSESEEDYQAYEKALANLHDRKKPLGCLFLIGVSGFMVFFTLFMVFFSNMFFSYFMLHDWEETTATIEEVWVLSEEISSSKDVRYNYVYEVVLGYRLSFPIEGGVARFDDWVKNAGGTAINVIPDEAYQFITFNYYPNKLDYSLSGGNTAICYNPNDPTKYRFGDHETIYANSTESMIFYVFGIPSLFFLILVVRGLIRSYRQKRSIKKAILSIPGSQDSILNESRWVGWFAIFVVFGIIALSWWFNEIYSDDYHTLGDRIMLYALVIPTLVSAVPLSVKLIRVIRQKRKEL
jgi:hypothetical protein